MECLKNLRNESIEDIMITVPPKVSRYFDKITGSESPSVVNQEKSRLEIFGLVAVERSVHVGPPKELGLVSGKDIELVIGSLVSDATCKAVKGMIVASESAESQCMVGYPITKF